ncbi:MAG: hypothetical protein ACUVXI_04630 [bacterium]
MRIDANGIYYRDLNRMIREAAMNGEREIEVVNVNGQRYIGTGLDRKVRIDIFGVPGNDMASFMNGATIIVHNNAQDAIGNTMNDGKVVVHGHAGDVLGYGMRGGKLFVKGDVGFRVGIHMKEYINRRPTIIIGGSAGDFLGEYMAGGVLILLGLTRGRGYREMVGNYLGTGMHGGIIFIRGDVPDYKLGKEVSRASLTDEDMALLEGELREFGSEFGMDSDTIMDGEFIKLLPVSLRPYGKIYAE